MASIGIVTNPSGMPGGAALEEVSTETTVEVKTLRDKSGTTKHAQKLGFVKKTVTARGYGDGMGSLGNVTAGGITGAKVMEVKGSESNEDFPKFEIQTVEYN